MDRQLSVFIDESGDFGMYQPHSPYYLVAMLFHDQRQTITHAVQLLDSQIMNLGFQPHALHTGPIIRREGNYINLSIDERKRLLNALIHFCRRVDVQYTILRVEKRECKNIIDLIARISKQIRKFVDTHETFFQAFDEVTVYYDNGQIELTQILTSTLSVLLPDVAFRRVQPSDYKLFQLIDMFCSLELTAIKFEANTPSRSELEVFHNYRDFNKDYLKKIRKKRMV
jgi:hypothetical protein